MDDNKPAVSVKNLTKSFRIPLDKNPNLKQKLLHGFRGKGYREFVSLRSVNFDVMPGEFFGIVGRNGSGKSTLLKSIAGIYTPDGGSVKVNGMLVPFIELGVGFNPELSGRENVYLSGALLGFSRKEIDGMYEEIVDFAELHDFMEERLRNYSSGMQVRLAFSIAIRARGDILLLDEVLAVGDANFQKKCFDYFDQLKRDKKTVILVSHSMDQVSKFCTRALLLDNGKIATIGLPSDVTKSYIEKNKVSSPIKTPEAKVVKKDVSIESVVLKNGSGRLLAQHVTGDGIEIIINCNIKNKVEKLNIGVGLHSEINGYVFGYNTKMDGYDMDNSKKSIKLKIKELPILKGDYYINAVCFGDDESTPYDLRLRAITFKAVGNEVQNRYRGTTYVKHEWEL
jgi:ABC-2 type transport system ATP-binding protein